MKKLFFLLACVAMSVLSMAQSNQLVWANGRLLYGTPVESMDSLTYDEMQDIDTLHLLLPRTLVKVIHDTVVVHDTVYVDMPCPDAPSTPSQGIGVFSVSATKQVTFSPGNLQYHPANDEWRFAANQTDYIGNANSNISSTYNGWIDLFGWGTSGYDNTTNDPNAYFYQPWSKSTASMSSVGIDSTLNCDAYEITGECEWEYTYGNSSYNDYGYGPSTNMQHDGLYGSSANYDWGVYNAISNGGNEAGLWRTLTLSEWNYILESRKNAQFLRSQATVNGVYGYVLLPDDFKKPADITWAHQTNNWSTNTYSTEQWAVLEATGAVFLPAAGYRYGSDVHSVRGYGGYWSATENSRNLAFYLYFYSTQADMSSNSRCNGYSVRLVKDL